MNQSSNPLNIVTSVAPDWWVQATALAPLKKAAPFLKSKILRPLAGLDLSEDTLTL